MGVFIYKARLSLIRIGKILPFLFCAIVAFSYSESLFAVLTNNYVDFCGVVLPNKPISVAIGVFAEYGVQTIVVLTIITIAIETCIYNKLGVTYLAANLVEKHIFDNIEISLTCFFVTAVTNIIIASLITYKGISILIKARIRRFKALQAHKDA